MSPTASINKLIENNRRFNRNKLWLTENRHRLAKIRGRNSQEELGQAAGVIAAVISSIERGQKYSVSDEKLAALIEVYKQLDAALAESPV